MIKKVIFSIFLFLLIPFVLADYIGNINYMPGYDYNIYVNESSHKIDFTNQINQYDLHTANYNSINVFTKRINYVWFYGWIFNNNMYLNQYVGTTVSHHPQTNQTSQGIFQSEFLFDMNNYFGSSQMLPITLIFDTNQQTITAFPTQFPGFIFQTLTNQNFGAFAVGPVLFQITLDSQGMIHIEEWVIVAPQWSVPLTQV